MNITHQVFDNLDPLDAKYRDELYKDGKKLAVLHAEYEIRSIQKTASVLEITLKKVWDEVPGQPVGTILKLSFTGVLVEASALNQPHERLEESSELSDLRPFAPDEQKRSIGYDKAVELSTDAGLWDVWYHEARAEFGPKKA
jgi:hypothetical protein